MGYRVRSLPCWQCIQVHPRSTRQSKRRPSFCCYCFKQTNTHVYFVRLKAKDGKDYEPILQIDGLTKLSGNNRKEAERQGRKRKRVEVAKMSCVGVTLRSQNTIYMHEIDVYAKIFDA